MHVKAPYVVKDNPMSVKYGVPHNYIFVWCIKVLEFFQNYSSVSEGIGKILFYRMCKPSLGIFVYMYISIYRVKIFMGV